MTTEEFIMDVANLIIFIIATAVAVELRIKKFLQKHGLIKIQTKKGFIKRLLRRWLI